VDPSKFIHVSTDGKNPIVKITGTNNANLAVPSSANTLAIGRGFEQDLFVAPSGKLLYVEPRLAEHAEQLGSLGNTLAPKDIAKATFSYVIASRPEYGSTTLAKKLVSEFDLVEKKYCCAMPPFYPIIKKASRNIFRSRNAKRRQTGPHIG
jgi:hypothetical protein